jgi:hypothetical protein
MRRTMNEIAAMIGNVPMPEGLSVVPLVDGIELAEKANELNRVSQADSSQTILILHGCAFRQGNRLQFSGAVALRDYQRIARVDTAEKHSTMEDVAQHANRPTVKSHLSKTEKYLKETAAKGEFFILPSFTLNYGAEFVGAYTGEGDSSATLYVVATPGALVSPAMLVLGGAAQLVVSDGAHRSDALKALTGGPVWRTPEPGGKSSSVKIKAGKLADPSKLLTNAVPILIVFDDDPARVKQDFADCASTSPIKPAMRAAFDTRNAYSRAVQDLIAAQPLLRKAVEATASGMSPSRHSPCIYTTAGLRSFFARACEHAETLIAKDKPALFPTERLAKDEAEDVQRRKNEVLKPHFDAILSSRRSSEFWSVLFDYLPPLKEVRPIYETEKTVVPVDVKNKYDGLGSIWLKPSGLSVLARVYAECIVKKRNMVKAVKNFAGLPDDPEDEGLMWISLVRIRENEGQPPSKSVVGTQQVIDAIWQEKLVQHVVL